MPTFDTSERVNTGFIKVKLVHAQGYSLLLPDMIVVDVDGLRWLQPKFFSACLLSFFDDGAIARMGIEPAHGVKLIVDFASKDLVRSYDDGSFLYRCKFSSPMVLKPHLAGKCSLDADHRVWLNLFHHTAAGTVGLIRKSGYFKGSRWNIQGNKKLVNVEYVYFTDLKRITNKRHLLKVAMASDGKIRLMPTNGLLPSDMVTIDVYRESTKNRCSTIEAMVPADAVASQHVWRHDALDQPVYYEASHPAIHRVGLEPGTVLPIGGDAVDIGAASLKRFDYVVLGYANTREGLVAPYDEEDTRELFKIERCETAGDPFAFWALHPNSDHYTGRVAEQQTFEPTR